MKRRKFFYDDEPNFLVYKPKKITFVNGKSYYLHRGYTYSRAYASATGARWRCTQTSSCKAYIRLSPEERLEEIADCHNHAAKKYLKLSNGMYIRTE
ncbi:unnamed protein product [Leptosia nina]|uniref:FLYWCH-type domain-containing protein n=1 Tax=Leptosia nina TaxID=320188 RepID=A0AAV1J460_9NEOP